MPFLLPYSFLSSRFIKQPRTAMDRHAPYRISQSNNFYMGTYNAGNKPINFIFSRRFEFPLSTLKPPSYPCWKHIAGRAALSIAAKSDLSSVLRAFCLGGGWPRKAPRMPPQVRDIGFSCHLPPIYFMYKNGVSISTYGQPLHCHLFPCWNNLPMKPLQGPRTPRRTARNDGTEPGR